MIKYIDGHPMVGRGGGWGVLHFADSGVKRQIFAESGKNKRILAESEL